MLIIHSGHSDVHSLSSPLSPQVHLVQHDGRGDCHRQVRLHGPAGPGAGHKKKRAPLAPRRLQVLVEGSKCHQQNGLCAVQLCGKEKQCQESFYCQESQRHTW